MKVNVRRLVKMACYSQWTMVMKEPELISLLIKERELIKTPCEGTDHYMIVSKADIGKNINWRKGKKWK